MSVQSSGKHQIRKQLAELQQRRRLIKSIPIATGVLPFIPTAIPLLGGFAAGLTDAYLRRQMAEVQVANIDDQRYALSNLDDCSVSSGTFLGLGMPLGAYKDGLAEYEQVFGRMTPDIRRLYLANQLDAFHPLIIPDSLLTRHIAMLGQTGVGKTETMMALLWGLSARGGGALVFEAKGGKDVPLRVYEMLKAQGREHMFRFLNFEDASLSHSYNPFFAGNPRSMISTGMMLLPQDGDEFFKDLNRYALSAAVVLLKHQPGLPAFSIKDLVVLFSDLNEFVKLYERLPTHSKEFREAKQYVFQFLRFWKTYDRDGNECLNTGLFQNRLMGLVSKLSAFTHSAYGQLVNAYAPEIDLKKAIEEGHVVVISLASLSDPDGSSLFGKLVLADFARAVGDVNIAGTKPMVPFMAFLDEYPSFKAEFHEKLWQLVRSANVALVLSAQGYNFLANQSETFAKNILANCWNHLFYDVRDQETRQLAKDLSQTVINLFAQDSESESYGHSQSSERSGVIGNISTGGGRSTGYKATREELVQQDDMILEEGDGILVGKSATYRMRLPIIDWKRPMLDWKDMELEHWDDKGHGLNLWDKSFDSGHNMAHLIR